MAPEPRRYFGWFSLFSLLAVVPLTWLATPGQAEERKFVILLGHPIKDSPGLVDLPNPATIWDAYFDKDKNAEPGQPGVRVDSFAEWWEEVSYGNVTVSGDVYGWTLLPWPTSPPGFNGETGFGSSAVIPHVDLQGGSTYQEASGEFFSPFAKKYNFDLDGVGSNPFYGNREPDFWTPFILAHGHVDPQGFAVWGPGERFLDLNDNRVYDAGVFEWAIDKNGNGQIDVDKQAFSFQQLFGCLIDYPEEEEDPPTFLAWFDDEAEWFDSNDDGFWNVDGFERFSRIEFFPVFPLGSGFLQVDFYRGDWGGAEMWFDRSDLREVGSRATQDERVRGEGNANEDEPPTIWEFLVQALDPEDDDVEYFDEQWNDEYDFPEPFEDYLRHWNTFAHDFVATSEEYIRNNYPGDADDLVARSITGPLPSDGGNGRYDMPDSWGNAGDVNSTNKLQEIVASNIADDAERSEKAVRDSFATGTNLGGFLLVPTWYREFWDDRYGSEPRDWLFGIPYLHTFDPSQEIPILLSHEETPELPFLPLHGGILITQGFPGFKSDGGRYTRDDGTVLPDIKDERDGMYDGPREFDDLPSSIYHAGPLGGGDQNFGEVTTSENFAAWGKDIGANSPNSPAPDGVVEGAGPLAFNVHGDGGFDGGNVLNTEYLTWNLDGDRFSTDELIDLTGNGVPDIVIYHRDTNLDGMIDLGETPGDAGVFGVPRATEYTNYGVDALPGTTPDGGPQSDYPFNRWRMMEDVVAGLDESVDWDDFLGGPGRFGNVVSGLVLLPQGTSQGMFSLPAGGPFLPLRTRDRENPNVSGVEKYVPILFFDGLGTEIGGGGEGGIFSIGEFSTPFAAHEYAHIWEGFPDLYDYDVFRSGATGQIINNPIAAWCVMSGGGLVHPVAILKEDAGWLTPVDLTTALTPLDETTITMNAWEFNPDKTVFRYDNPLFPGEHFYIWRAADGVRQSGRITRLSFDFLLPGEGIVIMHVDRTANPEGLPLQQRLGTHFTYEIVQADGLQQLQNGENFGDDGDVWPGSTGNVRLDRLSDPSNRWFSGQGSGLDITNIVQNENSSEVTFRWVPQDVPSFSWVQPPGGISVNGIYPLRYFAYDQHGGTTIQFFAVLSTPGSELTYDSGIPLGQTTKAPGDVDGVFQANVSVLLDGTYTLFAKLIPGIGADLKHENWNSAPRANLSNVGNGTLTVDAVDAVISKLERWTITVVNDQPVGAETWQIVGSQSGAQNAVAVSGVPYTSDSVLGADNVIRNALGFTIRSGNLPFRRNDKFTFLTTGLTPHSSAILIDNGNVVLPQPPVAVARVENGVTSGLAPLDVIFRHHDSRDPHGAALTFDWDFGDGTPGVQTTDPARPVTHTYTVPNMDPYVATLTVTNAFGLDDTAEIPIQVNAAAPPTVRATADLVTGIRPLRVRFTGDLTTDPNAGLQGLDFVWDFGDGSPLAMTANAEHIYQNAGNYLATLTVTNRPFNESASTIIEIRVIGPAEDQPPVAGFEVDRLSGQTPLTVLFDGNISIDPEGGVLEYLWNFDDGSPVIRGVSEIEHTFTNAGTYNVTLTVVDESNQLDRATKAIVAMGEEGANEGSPVARIVASATQGPAPFTVAFDAGNSVDPQGGPLSFAWDFGDGSEQEVGEFVTHTFTAARRYTVVLAVSDVDGNQGATTIEILVTVAAGDDAGAGIADIDTIIPEINNCGTTCGPVGMLPMMWTLIGIGGIRRMGRRFRP